MKKTPIFTTAEALEEAFYDALTRGDLPGLMSLWADDDDVVCIHPGGARATGLAAVRQAWADVLAGRLDIHPVSIRRTQGLTTAIHSLIEEISINGEHGAETVRCVATNVYVKDARGWRIQLHHASPAGDEPTAGATPGAMLH